MRFCCLHSIWFPPSSVLHGCEISLLRSSADLSQANLLTEVFMCLHIFLLEAVLCSPPSAASPSRGLLVREEYPVVLNLWVSCLDVRFVLPLQRGKGHFRDGLLRAGSKGVLTTAADGTVHRRYCKLRAGGFGIWMRVFLSRSHFFTVKISSLMWSTLWSTVCNHC